LLLLGLMSRSFRRLPSDAITIKMLAPGFEGFWGHCFISSSSNLMSSPSLSVAVQCDFANEQNSVGSAAKRPHGARNFLKSLRELTAVALQTGLCETGPTTGLRVKAKASAHGFRTWTEDDIAQFEAAHPIGTRARLAFSLLLYTGQRRGDVIRMGRRHVRGDLLTVRQAKTGATVDIPLHPELRAILAASCSELLTFLTTAGGKPFSAGAFTNWFGAQCRDAGLPLGLSAHGLRKAMCRRLAEAGCSTNQIAAISGHATLQEVSRCTKAANQRAMAVAAMQTISRAKSQIENALFGNIQAKHKRKQRPINSHDSHRWTSTSLHRRGRLSQKLGRPTLTTLS
jgi:site-specific recombinase XerD